MKVQTVIRKGADHPVYCEDALFTAHAGRYFIGAVFDGCSGGRESHFASSLFVKIFRQILTYNSFIDGETIEDKAKAFMKVFVEKLFATKKALDLEDHDMLATFIMLVYDKVHGECITMTIGDGLIHCDGKYIEFENDRFKATHPNMYTNMPDYIAYDIVELGLESGYFDNWFDKRVTITKFEDPQDISISTDGLFTFNTPLVEIEPIKFLLEDDKWMKNAIMLSKKVNVLSTKHKTTHKDDISIIRLIPNYKEDDSSSSKKG